jgi:hypothetical protein
MARWKLSEGTEISNCTEEGQFEIYEEEETAITETENGHSKNKTW